MISHYHFYRVKITVDYEKMKKKVSVKYLYGVWRDGSRIQVSTKHKMNLSINNSSWEF